MGKCLFNDNWLEDEKYRGWLKKGDDIHEARCAFCKKTIKLGSMGHKALDSHTQAEKHKKNVAAQATSLPIHIFTNPVEPSTTSQPSTRPPSSSGNAFGCFANTDTLKAEILWVLQTISRHHSYTSNEDVHLVFQAMFPDSQCASAFSCGRDKTAYLARFGVAPFLRKELISRANQDAFIIMFDESMNKTTKSKQLDLHVRHWTTEETGTPIVRSRYLGSQFLGHSTAEDLLEHFKVRLSMLLIC